MSLFAHSLKSDLQEFQKLVSFSLEDARYSKSLWEKFSAAFFFFFFLFKAMGEFNKGTFSDTEETVTALNVFYILIGISHMSNLP